MNFWQVFMSGEEALGQGHYQNRACTWLSLRVPLFW